MCFSAGASFWGSAVIGAIGVASVKRVQEPVQYFFAGIPLILAVHQFFEGLLWVALTHPHYAFLQPMATYIFLIFAQLFWPVWVPLSILLLEKEEWRKKALKILLGLGVFVSGYLMICFIKYPLYGEIIGRHIYYHYDFPYTKEWYSGLFYLVPTIIPPFISSVKRM